MKSYKVLAISTLLVILVVAGWVALGELVYAASITGYNKPFFYALLSTSGFILFLPIGFIGLRQIRKKESKARGVDINIDDNDNSTFSLGITNAHKRLFFASFIPSFCFLLGLYLQLVALPYSTVTVMMLLQDSSTIFTYLFGLILLKEKSSWRKSLAVVVTIIGMVLVGIGNSSDIGRPPGVTVEQSVLGAVAMGISALVWSFYEVWFRRIEEKMWDEHVAEVAKIEASADTEDGSESEIKSEIDYEQDPRMIKADALRMVFIQGWAGFIALTLYSWVIYLPFSYSGYEVFKFPTCCIEFNPWMIVAWPSNVFLNVALVIATPLFVQVGISLNVPVAAVADYFLYDIIPNWLIILGAVFVFSGFGVILWAYHHETSVSKSELESDKGVIAGEGDDGGKNVEINA